MNDKRQNSSKSPSRNSNSKRRRNNRHKSNNNNSNNNPVKKSNHNNNKRRHHKKRFHQSNKDNSIFAQSQTKGLEGDKLILRYGELFEQYLKARNQFYEVFGREHANKKDQAKLSYFKALKILRKFEENLSPEQFQLIEDNLCTYEKDYEYSSKRQIEINGEVNSVGEDNIHLLENQINRPNYSEDSVESSGTDVDLQKYKEAKSFNQIN